MHLYPWIINDNNLDLFTIIILFLPPGVLFPLQNTCFHPSEQENEMQCLILF